MSNKDEKLKIINGWLNTFPCNKFFTGSDKIEAKSCIKNIIKSEDILKMIEMQHP